MSAKKRIPVVIDTNVIVSGFLDDSDSYPAKIIDAWLFDRVLVAISHELKQELNKVFKKPYIVEVLQNHKSIKSILGRLFNKSLMIAPKSIDEVIFPDETDHFLLEFAVSAKALVIVTGDKRLLNIKRVRGIQILSPKQFCLKFKII